jgi:hypothetical protein
VLASVSLYRVRMDRYLFGLRVEDGGRIIAVVSVAHANNGNAFRQLHGINASAWGHHRGHARGTNVNAGSTRPGAPDSSIILQWQSPQTRLEPEPRTTYCPRHAGLRC